MADMGDSAIARALEDAAEWIGPGIEGVGEGRTDDGEPCIVVLASRLDPETRARIPQTHAGFAVVVHDTDTIHALNDD